MLGGKRDGQQLVSGPGSIAELRLTRPSPCKRREGSARAAIRTNERKTITASIRHVNDVGDDNGAELDARRRAEPNGIALSASSEGGGIVYALPRKSSEA